MLEVKKLRKQFSQGGTTVTPVNDVSFKVGAGEFASIIGRSGAGKSTLFGLLGALDTPTSGEILIDGKDITKYHDRKLTEYRRNAIGFVFQKLQLGAKSFHTGKRDVADGICRRRQRRAQKARRKIAEPSRD